MRLQSGTRQVFGRDSTREGMPWLTSASEGGSPSGMVSKWKPGKPSRELWPLDLSKRLWLYSVFTKVTWNPFWGRSFASLNIGFMWPWSGTGKQTTWGLTPALMEPISLFLSLSLSLSGIHTEDGTVFEEIWASQDLYTGQTAEHNKDFNSFY